MIISNIRMLIFFQLFFLLSNCCQFIIPTVADQVHHIFFGIVRQPIEDALELPFALALDESQSLFSRNTDYLILDVFLLVSDDQQPLLTELKSHNEVFIVYFPDPDHFDVAGEPVRAGVSAIGCVWVVRPGARPSFGLPERSPEYEGVECNIFDDLFLLFPLHLQLLAIIIRFLILQSLQHTCILDLNCLQLPLPEARVQTASQSLFIFIFL